MPENHDAEDVAAILARTTDDGPGNIPPGPGDLDHDGNNGGGEQQGGDE